MSSDAEEIEKLKKKVERLEGEVSDLETKVEEADPYKKYRDAGYIQNEYGLWRMPW